jgi:hypothetical protein
MTLDALTQIGRFLAGHPGRKNLIGLAPISETND